VTPLVGYDEFELDLTAAILEQLPPFLERISATGLHPAQLGLIESEAQGAYLLYLGRDIVYVGKSDAECGLRMRLQRHFDRIQHRVGLDPASIKFKAARIFSFSVMDVETILIKHYQSLGKSAKWNNSGFGSNDPGRERDTQKPSKFDQDYPLDYRRQLNISEEVLRARQSVYDFLRSVKQSVPFGLRFSDNKGELKAAKFTPIDVLSATSSVERLLAEVIGILPGGWQATILRGYCILYKETKEYQGQAVVFRSPKTLEI
jgi:hypothetical protein